MDRKEQPPLVKTMKSRLHDAVPARRDLVCDIELSMAFLNGRQFVKASKSKGLVAIENKAREHRVMDNQMLPAYEWRMAQLFKNQPVISSFGAGFDIADAEKAFAANKLCEHWRANTGWLEAEKEAGSWTMLGGLSFISPVLREIPGKKRKALRKEYAPEGVNDADGIIDFVREIQEDVPDSEISFDVFNILETFLFPLNARKWRDVEGIMTASMVSKAWALRQFPGLAGVELEKVNSDEYNQKAIDALNGIAGAEFATSHIRNNPDDANYLFLQYRERPSHQYERGRFIQIVGGHIVFEGELPYLDEIRAVDPLDAFNLTMGMVPWFDRVLPGRLIPPSTMSLMRAPQKEYNDLLTDQSSNRKTVGRNKILVEKGLLADGQFTNEQGEMIEVPAGPGMEPKVIQGQPLVGIFQEIQDKRRTLDDISGRNALARGENLPQVRSAHHLDILKEESSTLIDAAITRREGVHEWCARIALSICQSRMPKSRVIEICGLDAAGYALSFLSGDLYVDVRVKEGSALPRSHASREAKLTEMLQYGLFNDPETGQPNTDLVLRMMELGTLNRNIDTDNKHRQRARNENHLMAITELRDDRRIPQIIIIPLRHEDHALHMEEHFDFMCSPAWYSAPPSIQALFYAHVNNHRDLLIGQTAPEAFMDNPGDAQAFPADESQMLASGEMPPEELTPAM